MAANEKIQNLAPWVIEGELLNNSMKTSDRSVEINQMFSRIISNNDVNIKSQQRTDTDLTNEEKMEILKGIFEQDPCKFLSRFGPWISIEDLCCFCASSGSEMEYAIGVLKENFRAKTSGVCVKNRRYEALHRLEKDTSYFSEDEMRQRCPLLYEQYIGQYLTDQERLEQDEIKMKDEVKMSAFIFQQIDRDWLSKKEMEEREEEECVEEEDDSDSENGSYMEGHDKATAGCDVTVINPEDKLKLKYEFLNIMRQRFLDGLDDEFDYTKVDASDEYDNLDILGQDSEDKYFDEEEPETINKVINNGMHTVNEKQMLTDSGDEDYLSDKILEQCCASKR